jgi:hypothetical protein
MHQWRHGRREVQVPKPQSDSLLSARTPFSVQAMIVLRAGSPDFHGQMRQSVKAC